MRARPRRQKARRAPKDPAIDQIKAVTIDRLGAAGDGVGEADGLPVFVPLSLPGDELTVRLTERRGQGYAATLIESTVLQPRQQPICRYFSACGGCRLQHLRALDYRAWKQQKVEDALSSRGIEDVDIRPLIDGSPGTRRRLRLAFTMIGGRFRLGLRRRLGHEIVEIDACPIARPAIQSLLNPLARCLSVLDMTGKGGEVMITVGDNGLDLLLETPIEPSLGDREALASLVETEDLARLAWRPDSQSSIEPIAERRKVIINVGGVPIAIPPAAFLQATEETETAIRKAIAEIIDDAQSIADLFSGIGALALPFAADGRTVFAVENQASMTEALIGAARTAGLEPRVTTAIRDLEREPLSANELQKFDALIIDPPRAGARAQIDAIARSITPKTIAMVSCNPNTFARDARNLIDAGYHLKWVQPIDAFLYAAEIELVAAFEHPNAP